MVSTGGPPASNPTYQPPSSPAQAAELKIRKKNGRKGPWEPLNNAPFTPKIKTLDHELQPSPAPPPLPTVNHRRGESDRVGGGGGRAQQKQHQLKSKTHS